MVTDMPFPLAGIDLQQGFGIQRPGTTRDALNVYGFEPVTDRDRGGSRPGTTHLVAGRIPAGSTLIQELNIVVNGSAGFLLDNKDPPGPGIEDPSTPGPSSLWPPGVHLWDPNSDDQSDQPQEGRVPPKKKRRKGGSGIQPGKVLAPPHGICVLGFYSCIGQLHLTGGTLDGTNPSFSVHGCYMNPTLLAALSTLTGIALGWCGPPSTAQGFRNWKCQVQKFYNDNSTPGHPAWLSSTYTGTTFVSPGDWVSNPNIVPRACTGREMSPPILITYGQRGSILIGCINGTGEDSPENTCTGVGFPGNPDTTTYTFP
jgi:hypothetical protein